MTTRLEAFATAASECVGVRYRLYGRDPAFGLDCVGLVLHALERSDGTGPDAPPYGLRNTHYNYVQKLAGLHGFETVQGDLRRGDCLCVIPGPAQLHLLVALSPDLLVHADAARRAIVRLAGPLPWPILYHFRFIERG